MRSMVRGAQPPRSTCQAGSPLHQASPDPPPPLRRGGEAAKREAIPRATRGLIVTADDFGVALVVNSAVEQAHTQGVLTAASLMVGGDAVGDAVERARRLPSLRVGLHLVLIEGRPVSPAAQLPDLVDASGRFRRDMVRCAVDIFFRPRVRRQLAVEITAQFEAFRATGLTLDHVNTHKHFHLHPTILGLILKIGRRYGLCAMRVPSEPRAVLRAAEAGARVPPAYVTAPWSALVRRRLRRAGVATADQVFGLQWSGAMTTQRLAGLVANLPCGVSEIYTHPALSGGFDGAAEGYDYEGEFAALVAPEVLAAVDAGGFTRGGFADVVRSTAGLRRRQSDVHTRVPPPRDLQRRLNMSHPIRADEITPHAELVEARGPQAAVNSLVLRQAQDEAEKNILSLTSQPI